LQVAKAGAASLIAGNANGPALVTAQAAAKRLNCSADVIKGLKRAGHLDLGRRRGREAISLASLAEFEQTYEPLAVVALASSERTTGLS
jgi:hypothetical protein